MSVSGQLAVGEAGNNGERKSQGVDYMSGIGDRYTTFFSQSAIFSAKVINVKCQMLNAFVFLRNIGN